MPFHSRRYFVIFYTAIATLTAGAAFTSPELAVATINIPFVHFALCAIFVTTQGSSRVRERRAYLAQNYPDLEKAIFGGLGRIPGGSPAMLSLRAHRGARTDPNLQDVFAEGRRDARVLWLAFLAIPWNATVLIAALLVAEEVGLIPA